MYNVCTYVHSSPLIWLMINLSPRAKFVDFEPIFHNWVWPYPPFHPTHLSLPSSDMTFYAPPLPSGGPVLLYILNTLNSYNFSSEDLTPGTGYPKGLVFHRMVEAFKFAFAARSKMGDPMCWQAEGCSMDLLQLQEEMTKWVVCELFKASDHWNVNRWGWFINTWILL